MVWLVLAVVLLLALSALFSSAETALTSVSKVRIHALAAKGSKRAGIVKSLQANMEQVIGTILLGNNFVNILATSLATNILVQLFGEGGVGIATLVMTLLILLFAEVMPKVYALQHADSVSLNVSPVVYYLSKVFSPITRSVRAFVKLAWRLFGVKDASGRTVRSSREEMLSLVEMYGDQAVAAEKSMLKGILDLESVPVSDVMVHRRDIMALNGDRLLSDALPEILNAPYSRFPVWVKTSDNIVGVFHIRAALKDIAGSKDIQKPIKEFVPESAWFVPESTTLRTQLQAFRHKRAHMALVVDEYGSLQGMITLEDILEEIVGEITDEYDDVDTSIRVAENGHCYVSGLVTIRDLNKRFSWSLPDEEAATIGGLLIYETRGLPSEGEVYTFYGLRFRIVERYRNQITRIEIMPRQPRAS